MSRRGGDDWFQDGGSSTTRRSRRDSLSGPREFRQEYRPGDWDCERCKAHNFSRRDTCFKCDTGRPGSSGGGTGDRRSRSRTRSRSRSPRRRRSPIYRDYRERQGFKNGYTHKEGDWQCQCGFDNFARRDRCFKCGSSKSRDSKGLPTKRDGDWFCRSCEKDNFAWRSECFSCGERK